MAEVTSSDTASAHDVAGIRWLLPVPIKVLEKVDEGKVVEIVVLSQVCAEGS